MTTRPLTARLFAGFLAFGLLAAGSAAGQNNQAGQVNQTTDRYAAEATCAVHQDRLQERLRRLSGPSAGSAAGRGTLQAQLQEARALPELAAYLRCLGQ